MVDRTATGDRHDAALFWFCLALFVAFVLSLPLFPTGDGPLHIYFAHVFWNVARHPDGAYAQVYAVRHLVQPYALHYYLLIALGHFVSADVAEKLFLVLILITLATGFRALAAALGKRSGAVALCVFPLLLNWTLGAGLLNYTFAVGLLLWGLALYYRLRRIVSLPLLGYVLVLGLLLLAHPVPLLLLILMLCGDLVWTALQRERALPPSRITAVALACCALVIPLLLADRSQMAKSVAEGLHLHVLWLRYLGSGVRLGLMYLPDPAGWLYLAMLVSLLPLSVAAALRSGWAARLLGRRADAADRLLVSTLLFLLGTPFLPEHLNGSALFADRMWLPVWLLGTACAASFVRGPRQRQLVRACALAATALSLGLAVVCLRPIALRQQQLESAPLPAGQSGLFMLAGSPDARLGSPGMERTTYPLYYWSGARRFFAHRDVLLNSPWMNLTIMPVRFRKAHKAVLPGALEEDPTKLALALARHSAEVGPALRQAGFVLYSDPSGAPAAAATAARQMLGQEWRCTAGPFYALCTHAAAH